MEHVGFVLKLDKKLIYFKFLRFGQNFIVSIQFDEESSQLIIMEVLIKTLSCEAGFVPVGMKTDFSMFLPDQMRFEQII